MKIVFVCGSLEPGCDGVGDYIRRLLIELIKNGHNICAIALNDKHLHQLYNGFEEIENEQFAILRIPSFKLSNCMQTL